MTIEEVHAILEANDISTVDFAYGEFDEIPELGPFTEVSSEGGEGQGDHWETVKFFPAHEFYIKTVGYHSSYSGTEFYSGYGTFVTPIEKTITVYE